MNGKKGLLVLAAMAGLVGAAAAGCSSHKTGDGSSMDKSSCSGKTSCSGKQTCSGGSSCSGKQSCSGGSSCGKNSCSK